MSSPWKNNISLLFPLLPNQVVLCQLGGVKVPDDVHKAGDISSGQRLYSWQYYCGRAYFGDQAFFECFFEWLWCLCLPKNIINSITSCLEFISSKPCCFNSNTIRGSGFMMRKSCPEWALYSR